MMLYAKLLFQIVFSRVLQVPALLHSNLGIVDVAKTFRVVCECGVSSEMCDVCPTGIFPVLKCETRQS